ncbi:MAG TPA: GNAT family N-acetyltransferase [Kofleriaceae bacterium]|jgi:GNAT superfamily N-acetyltransferase|nr:GNAT family N-acetyltransferase [Kofleriaceae bacterium]
MLVHSVGLTTDLALIATRGRVVDRGGYLVTCTPDDPGYFHGNMLVLPAPLRPGELPAMIDLFAREVAIDPEIRHVTLMWDGVTGDTGAPDELAAAGFVRETRRVMVAPQVTAPAAPRGIELRPLAPDELARAAELDFAIREDDRTGDDHASEAYRRFRHRRAAWQRELVIRRLAQFWGAFDDRTLVGSLGLVQLGRLGRYQDVQTTRSHRRRGVASALLATAAAAATARSGIEELVIQTVAGNAAERVYQRAGFRTIEHTVSAYREPRATIR